MAEFGYRKLIVYKKAKELVLLIYLLTKGFPEEEKYSLVPQLRRAIISVLANIVEGYSRESRKDFARFLNISIASSTEVGLYLELAHDLGYVSADDFAKSSGLLEEISKMLYAFHRKLKTK
ncbi:MAG: four helix bundle protein [Patescibacteria group bacterium]